MYNIQTVIFQLFSTNLLVCIYQGYISAGVSNLAHELAILRSVTVLG